VLTAVGLLTRSVEGLQGRTSALAVRARDLLAVAVEPAAPGISIALIAEMSAFAEADPYAVLGQSTDRLLTALAVHGAALGIRRIPVSLALFLFAGRILSEIVLPANTTDGRRALAPNAFARAERHEVGLAGDGRKTAAAWAMERVSAAPEGWRRWLVALTAEAEGQEPEGDVLDDAGNRITIARHALSAAPPVDATAAPRPSRDPPERFCGRLGAIIAYDFCNSVGDSRPRTEGEVDGHGT
jgi:hypothetical protein